MARAINVRYEHNGYMTQAIKYPKQTVAACVKYLKPRLDKFDAIAFTGNSGALIAPMVAMRLGKPIILVRKEKERSHSDRRCEGASKVLWSTEPLRYLILDDFMSSGKSVYRIVRDVQKFTYGGVCVGFLSYARLIDDGKGVITNVKRELKFIQDRRDTFLVNEQRISQGDFNAAFAASAEDWS